MNILTYATPVSVAPERIWSIGLYKETLTRDNFAQRRFGVLQLLQPPHSSLVPVLGGVSGRDVDKAIECSRRGFPWGILEGREDLPLVLPGCSYYLFLVLQGELIDCGSHDVAICRVESMFVDEDVISGDGDEVVTGREMMSAPPYLNTALLRDRGIITQQGRVAE
eukprot:CAMPEP_0172501784 /NCGR_PEP_ID=MMETSP1066-20121228/153488_1 /TAXON_ID=671091 /ORGANISM="Coscinodiscus wailesii, Strain CCMP2513" /LENGTH=165 /DNA_ID=CAMNT_0013276767 /DNA_START=247 /DNA_END=744 /DNA_ORIENTATION=+